MGVKADDGCWTLTPDGRLLGYFENDTESTDVEYRFERKDGAWTLVATQNGTIVRNPYDSRR
jgi:hypothetical protein